MASIAAAAAAKPNIIGNNLLLPSPSFNSNLYLSPSSAYKNNTSQYNPQRRRNSYAASSTISENIVNDSMMTSGGSRNTGSTHFLDPSMAAACRRRLPPTPASILTSDKGIDISNNAYTIRRGSSPRILPTPPPHSPPAVPIYLYRNSPNIEPKVSPQSSPQHINKFSDANFATSLILERRPSTGRRLPPEPNMIRITAIKEIDNKNLNKSHCIELMSFDNNSPLQRSASARSPQQLSNK